MASTRGPGRSSRHGKSQGRVTKPARHEGSNTGRFLSAEDSGRYTAPTPRSVRESPRWYGIMILSLLVGGVLVICLNYLGGLWHTTSWMLVVGVVLIMSGFVALLRWH